MIYSPALWRKYSISTKTHLLRYKFWYHLNFNNYATLRFSATTIKRLSNLPNCMEDARQVEDICIISRISYLWWGWTILYGSVTWAWGFAWYVSPKPTSNMVGPWCFKLNATIKSWHLNIFTSYKCIKPLLAMNNSTLIYNKLNSTIKGCKVHYIRYQ